jgi:hypothetical protein
MLQAFRFGVQDPEALKAIDMAFELAPAPSPDVYKGAMKTLTLARLHTACIPRSDYAADAVRWDQISRTVGNSGGHSK